MSSILGGSKSKSQQTASATSSNQAYPFLSQTYQPQITNGIDGSNALRSLLGLDNDPTAFNNAFSNYRNSTGYDFTLGQGMRAINGNSAARGMLNSGATLKALNTFGQDTSHKFFNDYLDRLLGLSSQGTQMAQILAGAGQQSNSQSQGTSTSKSSPGITGMLGTALSFIPK